MVLHNEIRLFCGDQLVKNTKDLQNIKVENNQTTSHLENDRDDPREASFSSIFKTRKKLFQ